MKTADLLARHAPAWHAATHHPFLDGVRDGTVPEAAFRRWLQQDRLFVADLLRFQALLLARAPRPDQAVLAGGVVALEAELTWFEQHGASDPIEALPTTLAYRACLEELHTGSYEAAVVALWAIERAYLEAWQTARPGAERFREFVEHWTVPAFADYVRSLERAADAGLARCEAEAEAAFVRIAELERAFWDMATGA